MTIKATNMERQFSTPLGVVRCGLNYSGFEESIAHKKYENGQAETIITLGHRIEMIAFQPKLLLYNGETVEGSCGWIFRIEKSTDTPETIETYCLLDRGTDGIAFDFATGEHLDAIEAENEDWTLHIGTEDGEMLNARAKIGDWFPARLENKANPYQSITAMKHNGFATKIPALYKGERIHIQYLTAYDKRDEQKVNTWLAVDAFKGKLEDWIGL